MAPRYSLLDDQDQLGSLLEPNTLQSLQPSAYEMSPSPQPQAAATMPDLHKRDPEVEDAWRGLELQKIHEAQKPSYGLAEGARDVIPTGLALALDAALNHGRGAVGVLQGGLGEVTAQQALRDKERAAAGELAVKIHGKEDNPLAYLRAQTAMQNAGTNATRVGNSQQHWEAAGDPTDPNTQGRLKVKELGAGAQARGRITEEDALNPIVAKNKGAIRTAETNAQLEAEHGAAPVVAADKANERALITGAELDTTHAKAPITNADAADRAAAVANAGIAPEVAKQQALNPVLEERSRNSTNAGVGAGLSAENIIAANTGLDFGDSKLLQQALKTRAINAKTLDDIKSANRAREIYDRMHEAIANYQQLPISEMATGRGAELRNTLAGHAKEFAGVVGKMSGNNSMENARSAEDLVPNIHNPYALDKLKGIWSALEANANGNLGAIGGRMRLPKALGGADFVAQASQDGAPPPPAAPDSDALPGEAVPADLGTTSGRVPPISAANNTVTVTLNGISRPYPRDVAQRMKQLDPRVELSE